MPRVWLRIKKLRGRQAGFALIEVLLAATIFGFLSVALVGAIVYGRQSTARAGDFNRATALADEGVEAVRNIRDAGFSNLTDGTYGIAKSGGQWILSGSSDTTNIYTRQIVLSSVDGVRKSITSTVSWSTGGVSHQVTATGRLTDWLAALVVPASWANAILAGSYDATGTNNGYKVATAGNYAYVVVNVTGATNFYIVNISNPSAPALVTGSTLTLANAPTNIAVSGNYAYVSTSNGNGELMVVNVTNPGAPTVASTYNAPGTAGALGVYAVGSIVYLTRTSSSTSGTNEFLIVNASIPTAPALLGSYNNNVVMYDVYVQGNYAYVATGANSAEVMVIDVTTKSAPTLLTSVNLAGSNDATTITGALTTLYVGQGTALWQVDISTPASSTAQTSVTASGTINDVTVDSTSTPSYGFIATSDTAAEFQVVDLRSAPTSISILKTVDVPGTTSTLNGVAYNATSDMVVGVGAADTQEVEVFTKN